MPFKSEAQRRFMHAKHPEVAKEFEKETPKGKKLPQHVHGETHHDADGHVNHEKVKSDMEKMHAEHTKKTGY